MSTSSSTSPGTGSTGATGTLRVMMKDSPFTEASAVLVTFSEVSVHRSAGAGTDTGEWTKLSTGTQPVTCDLMRLRAGAQPLGIGNIAPGHYTQIRLIMPQVAMYQGGTTSSGAPCVVGEASGATALIPTGTPTGPLPVTVPSGDIKLNHEFDLAPNTTITITLDFDGDKSIHKTGNGTFMMSPVIGIASVVVG